MGILLDLLTLPALGTPRLVHWLARTLAQEAEAELLDEGRVRGQLTELQARYDAGQLDENECESQEKELLERLLAIRRLKARREASR